MMKDKKIDINYQMEKLNNNEENLAHLVALSGEVEFLDFIMEKSKVVSNMEYPFHRDKEDNSILHKAALQDKYGSYFFRYLYSPIERKAFLLVGFLGMMTEMFTI